MSDITFKVSGSSISLPPEYVGCWVIGGKWGLHVHQTKKPRWLTRKMALWLLEWEWRDD